MSYELIIEKLSFVGETSRLADDSGIFDAFLYSSSKFRTSFNRNVTWSMKLQ